MCHERHDLVLSCWVDVPIPLGSLRPNEFAVVLEDHVGRIAHLQGQRCGIVEVRQMVAGKRVPQGVVWPICEANAFACLVE